MKEKMLDLLICHEIASQPSVKANRGKKDMNQNDFVPRTHVILS